MSGNLENYSLYTRLTLLINYTLLENKWCKKILYIYVNRDGVLQNKKNIHKIDWKVRLKNKINFYLIN